MLTKVLYEVMIDGKQTFAADRPSPTMSLIKQQVEASDSSLDVISMSNENPQRLYDTFKVPIDGDLIKAQKSAVEGALTTTFSTSGARGRCKFLIVSTLFLTSLCPIRVVKLI